MPEKVHQGRAVKRIREILQVKQETLASELGISQQSVSLLETKETIDPETLEQIAKTLKVPVEAIRNFNEEAAVNIIANTFQDESVACLKRMSLGQPLRMIPGQPKRRMLGQPQTA
jgi:transcriptional regulator with XRE-family HTH domain